MKLITSIALLIIAVVMFAIFAPFGVIYTIVTSLINLENPFNYIAYVVKKIAVSIDQLGNVVCGDLFNVTLSKTGAPFGHEDDTISKQLHINRNNLTKLGSVIYQTLERIDPGHGKKSLND